MLRMEELFGIKILHQVLILSKLYIGITEKREMLNTEGNSMPGYSVVLK